MGYLAAPEGERFFGGAPAPAPPAAPVFRLDCAGGCAQAGANDAECRRALRQAIVSAIGVANTAAAALEENPRADRTRRIFRFFFGHDPSRAVAWANNQESGATVAHRLRKVAEALQGRNTQYRCAAPPANRPNRRARAVSPNEVLLHTRFWDPPAGLGMSNQLFRAAVLLHEMLHLLYDDFLVHDDAERRRNNAHCYEAFAMRVAGHAADPTDVTQCRERPA
jgi:hypothetical protein